MTHYIWDPLNDSYLAELDSSTSSMTVYSQCVNTFGGVISQSGIDGSVFYHEDRIGSTRLLTDGSQTIVGRYDFDSWGKVIFYLGLAQGGFLWSGQTGYYYDWDLGAYYVRLRTFRTTVARWSSLDSRLFGDHINGYLGFLNNPLRFTDSEGAMIEEIAKVVESGDWRFRLTAGPSQLTDGFQTHIFNVKQKISLVDIPKKAVQVWQVSATRRFIHERSPGCLLVNEDVVKSDVSDLRDIPNDGFVIDIGDAQGIFPTKPPPGTPGPLPVNGPFYQDNVCQLFQETFVIIGFDDGNGRLPLRQSKPPRDLVEFQRLVNSKNQGRYSYTYEFRNHCGFCLSCGIQCDCRPHEVITTPWVKATDENRLPVAKVPNI